jgi:transcriptional regulator of heat shock response
MNMMLTQRQQKILEAIIREYIQGAEPISSQLLKEKYDFGIKNAMIRREMQELCDLGYLAQPHPSAGRIPTEKGYRSYVDKLLGELFGEDKEDLFEFDFRAEIEKEKDIVRLFDLLTRKIAFLVSNFTLGYMNALNVVWKAGWQEILLEPEFRNQAAIVEFVQMVETIERQIGHMTFPGEIQVYIGRENPFFKTPDFSTVITRCAFKRGQEGIIAVIGPTRMHYEHTIRIVWALKKFLDEQFLSPSYGRTGKRKTTK